MVLMALGVCACNKSTEKKNEQVKETATSTVQPTDAVSGSSVTETSTPISVEEAYALAEDMLLNMTLEQKIGQMFIVDLYQLDSRRSLDGTLKEATTNMGETIRKYHVGGVYLTELNIKNKDQSQEMISQLQAQPVTGGSLYIAVEEDGGGSNSISNKVAGLNDTGFIAPSEMATNMKPEQILQAGEKIGSELTKIGINLNLSPVADIGNENNPEYAKRCLGTDAEGVSSLLESYVKGMRQGGIAVTLKYFPGVGNVTGDFTEDILDNTDSLMALRENNLQTYQSGIDAGADCVMMSNASVSEITVDKIPAFMSYDIVTNLLRKELNFDGVIMTPPCDDNAIRNNYSCSDIVVESVKAGCDMIVLPNDFKACYEALLLAVKTKEIDEKVIDESVCRILQNKIRRGILESEQK